MLSDVVLLDPASQRYFERNKLGLMRVYGVACVSLADWQRHMSTPPPAPPTWLLLNQAALLAGTSKRIVVGAAQLGIVRTRGNLYYRDDLPNIAHADEAAIEAAYWQYALTLVDRVGITKAARQLGESMSTMYWWQRKGNHG